jgi:hypothetical protein
MFFFKIWPKPLQSNSVLGKKNFFARTEFVKKASAKFFFFFFFFLNYLKITIFV